MHHNIIEQHIVFIADILQSKEISEEELLKMYREKGSFSEGDLFLFFSAAHSLYGDRVSRKPKRTLIKRIQ